MSLKSFLKEKKVCCKYITLYAIIRNRVGKLEFTQTKKPTFLKALKGLRLFQIYNRILSESEAHKYLSDSHKKKCAYKLE